MDTQKCVSALCFNNRVCRGLPYTHASLGITQCSQQTRNIDQQQYCLTIVFAEVQQQQ